MFINLPVFACLLWSTADLISSSLCFHAPSLLLFLLHYFSNGFLPPDIKSLLPSDIIFCSANTLLPALLPVCCLVTTHLPSSYPKEPNHAVNQTPPFVYLLEHHLLKQIVDAYCSYHMSSNLSCYSTDASRLYDVRYTPHPPMYLLRLTTHCVIGDLPYWPKESKLW